MLSLAIKSFFDMLKQALSLKETDLENKPTLEIVKEKKSLKKATNYTEQIIEIVDKYTNCFTKSDRRKYKSLKKKFNKNN